MSERSSFVTEYMYCKKCLESMKKVLLKDEKYLKGVQVEGWLRHDNKRRDTLPIIAGKTGGLGPSDEIIEFQYNLFNEKNAPCHKVRVAILADSGKSIVLVVSPDGSVDEEDDLRESEREKELEKKGKIEIELPQELINKIDKTWGRFGTKLDDIVCVAIRQHLERTEKILEQQA